jgi:hypothetical protein
VRACARVLLLLALKTHAAPLVFHVWVSRLGKGTSQLLRVVLLCLCPLAHLLLFRTRPRRQNTVFISFRIETASEQALQLKDALEAVGVSTYVCKTRCGDDILTEIGEAIADCELAVVLGTETFGEKTGGFFSTWEELTAIKSEKKPIFLIKMCDQFRFPNVRFCFPSNIAYTEWLPYTDMPADLVEEILGKIAFPARRA